MAGIPDEKLQELRDRIDIVDLIGRYVGLRRAGRNHKACCPFHSEKTPSFFVNPERRSFKCFGCGVYGDGLEFVMKIEGLSFPEAAHKLAGLYGVQLPTRGGLRPEQQADRQASMEIMRAATQFYRELLVAAPAGEAARGYQQQRGVSEATAEAFGLGYAPDPTELGWDPLCRALSAKGLPLELAERLGLVLRSDRTGAPFDRFRGRWMFPIILPGGTVVGFSGRILPVFEQETDGQKPAKYVNSPESDLYKKSKCLFGLHLAGQAMRTRRRAILVEGNVDVVAMHQRGYQETIAPLGTSLTSTQAQLIGRFTDTVVLCFDGDRAGLKAAESAIPVLLEAELDARIVVLGAGEDPDSADPARLDNLLERPQSALEWYMHRLVRQGATESIDAQARALSAVAPLLRKIKREAARDLYIDRAAKLLNLSPSRVLAVVRGHDRGGPSRFAPDERFSPPPHRNQRNHSNHANQRPQGNRFSKQRNNRYAPRGNQMPPQRGGRADRFAPPPDFVTAPPEFAAGPPPGPPPDLPPDSRFHPSPVQASVPNRRLPALPRVQANLTALLVDNPTLLAELDHQELTEFIDDRRLRPILEKFIADPKQASQLGIGELLEGVDPRAHRQIHDQIFAGTYRDTELDLQRELAECLHGCRREQIKRSIAEFDNEIRTARTQGDMERVRDLSRQRMDLSRQLHSLGHTPARNMYKH